MDPKINEALAGTAPADKPADKPAEGATLNHDVNPAGKVEAENAVEELKRFLASGLRFDARVTSSAADWQALQDMIAAAIASFANGGTTVCVIKMRQGTDPKTPGFLVIGFGEKDAEDAAALLKSAIVAITPKTGLYGDRNGVDGQPLT